MGEIYRLQIKIKKGKWVCNEDGYSLKGRRPKRIKTDVVAFCPKCDEECPIPMYF